MLRRKWVALLKRFCPFTKEAYFLYQTASFRFRHFQSTSQARRPRPGPGALLRHPGRGERGLHRGVRLLLQRSPPRSRREPREVCAVGASPRNLGEQGAAELCARGRALHGQSMFKELYNDIIIIIIMIRYLLLNCLIRMITEHIQVIK